jgi:hypothetical protein
MSINESPCKSITFPNITLTTDGYIKVSAFDCIAISVSNSYSVNAIIKAAASVTTLSVTATAKISAFGVDEPSLSVTRLTCNMLYPKED